MIRIVKLSGTYYAMDMCQLTDKEILEDVRAFTESGDPVLLVEDLSEAKWFDQNATKDNITVVERENDEV